MVAFNTSGGDGASMGSSDPGDEDLSIREWMLSRQEKFATGIEQAGILRNAAVEMVAGATVEIPKQYLNDPKFAEIVRLFKLQQQMSVSAAECAESTTAVLLNWLVIARNTVNILSGHIS